MSDCYHPHRRNPFLGLNELRYYGGYNTQAIEDRLCIPGRYEYVYHLVNMFGDLLYVGRTRDPLRRLREHHRKPWWPDVEVVAIYLYEPELVGQAEALDIKDLAPIHNVALRVMV